MEPLKLLSKEEIHHAAAKVEPDVDDLEQKLNQQRWQHMAVAVRIFEHNGPLMENLDEEYATDTVWTLTSPEVFLLLTRDRRWSKEKYIHWLADALIKELLP
jgi:hypothetical protein